MSYNPFQSTANSQQENTNIDPLMLDFALPIGTPTKFSGNSIDLEGFIQHCELNFGLKSLLFRTDSHKVAYMFSYMEGDAKAFVANLIRSQSPVITNYDAFVALLRRVFGNTDIVFNFTQAILALRQKRIGEVGQYINWYNTTHFYFVILFPCGNT